MTEQAGAEGVGGSVTTVSGDGGRTVFGRYRRHALPARRHPVKVLYGEQERATVELAAELAGLLPSSYVAAAALLMAQGVVKDSDDAGPAGRVQGRPVVASAWEDRELLTELIQARLALRRYGVNVNQAAAVLNRCENRATFR